MICNARRAPDAIRTALLLTTVLTGAASAAPPEVEELAWCGANRECLSWTGADGATQYRLYRGGRADLPGLLDGSFDACSRRLFATTTSGPTLPDAPPAGQLLWYLVTAADGSGEGSAGEATAGSRRLDSSGDCALACGPAHEPQPNVGLAESPGSGGCPAGMLLVSTFCIDRYEASLVRMDDGRPWSPYVHPTVPVRAVSLAGAIPQGFVSGNDARDACLNAGKRLCTSLEWQRACRGPFNTTYPYGNSHVSGACNDSRPTHPAADLFGGEAWDLTDRCLNQQENTLDPTGANAGCATVEGVLDMVGNLHEWVEDAGGTFRGGDFHDATLNGHGCLFVTTAHHVTHWQYSTGFRCCSDP